jgi:hypothetical protein
MGADGMEIARVAAWVPPLTAEEKRRASLYVTGMVARDAAEARELLEALGLIEPRTTTTTSQGGLS